VSDARAAGVLVAIREEFAPYGLNIRVPWIRDWERPAFSQQGITRDVARRPLEAPCDRVLAFVGRDVRDFVWGAVMPEILGAVELRTRTKGYVVVEMGSLNQLLTFSSPAGNAVHEFYHMLGCDHWDGRKKVQDHIARLKRAARDNRARGEDFFPGLAPSGRLYLTRGAVDRRFGLAAATPAPVPATGLARND
jgi:hypothetical protein